MDFENRAAATDFPKSSKSRRLLLSQNYISKIDIIDGENIADEVEFSADN